MDVHSTARIEPNAWVDRTWPKGVHIEEGAYVGEEVVILTHDFTRGLYLDTRIGARTVIGHRAMVLPGLQIGRDCIVMPGAVVTKDVPDGHVAMGNPASAHPRQACDPRR